MRGGEVELAHSLLQYITAKPLWIDGKNAGRQALYNETVESDILRTFLRFITPTQAASLSLHSAAPLSV